MGAWGRPSSLPPAGLPIHFPCGPACRSPSSRASSGPAPSAGQWCRCPYLKKISGSRLRVLLPHEIAPPRSLGILKHSRHHLDTMVRIPPAQSFVRSFSLPHHPPRQFIHTARPWSQEHAPAPHPHRCAMRPPQIFLIRSTFISHSSSDFMFIHKQSE